MDRSITPSNTELWLVVEGRRSEWGIDKHAIACVVGGRGPGSFTGVRISMATAKGVSAALEVPLYGVSTLDSIAWGLQHAGLRGHAVVVADAMRKEVYPVRLELSMEGIARL